MSRDLRAGIRRRTQYPGQGLRCDLDRRLVPLGPAAHHLGADRAERIRQPPHPRFPGVAADDGSGRLVGEADLAGRQPMVHELQRQQVPGRDDSLRRLGVPGQLDQRHAFPQPQRHRSDAAGRGHEERLGQVERQIDIAVTKRGARRRGDGLEQRRYYAALLVQTVDLVEDEHGIADTDAAQLLDDPSGRARAGAVQPRRTIQLGAGHPRAGAPERRGNQPRQRRLAHPRRAHQAEQRRRRVRLRQAHGDVVDEALLHRAVSGMPCIEDRPGAREIEPPGGALRPGQARQATQILAFSPILGIGRQQPGQPREDLPPPLPHGVRHPARVELFAEAVDTRTAQRDDRRRRVRAFTKAKPVGGGRTSS